PPLRILFVEDDKVSITFGAALLKKLGFDCTVAENGRECLTALETGSFDLVLTDIRMPVMNGEEALCEIRRYEQGTTAHQPVIAMTAHSMREEKERFLAQGFDGYISKPLITKELIAEMKRVLGEP
ncbi:MAG: response regulator, partial [Desulfuromonadales bacterium]